MSTHQQRAIAEHRAAHLENDDLPDDAIASLTIVQMRVLGLACNQFGSDLRAALSAQLRRGPASGSVGENP